MQREVGDASWSQNALNDGDGASARMDDAATTAKEDQP